MITQEVNCDPEWTGERALSVSVVVPTRDRCADLERCLEAISKLHPSPMEILVVDGPPREEGARDIALQWHAHYFREDVPGASRARNRGAREACGDIVAYTDDDAVPDVNWLGPMLNEFNDAKVALVAGKVVPPKAEPELNRLYEICGFTGQSSDRTVVDRSTPHWFQKVSFLPFGIGPNLAIRRSVFRQWGGFDERLGPGTPVPGHEEQLAFLRLINLGFRLVYLPTARVTHPLHECSVKELQMRSLRRMQASSAYLTLLMVEEPKCRHDVLEYIIHKFRCGMESRREISRTRCLIARLQGLGLYFKSRLEHRVRTVDEHVTW